MRLPHFFVVGAQKAGTTTLHERLAKHPEVSLPRLKETQFFAFEEKFQYGIEWYQRLFDGSLAAASAVGEVCPDYLYFPGAAERISRYVEAPKLIFVFRNPLRRAYSHYLMSVRQGFEALDFSEALIQEGERLAESPVSMIYHSYMARGCYAHQVERFIRVFPNSEFLFLRFEDLVDPGYAGAEVFDRICKFIGVSRLQIGVGQRSNVASRPRSRLLRDFLYGQSVAKRALGGWLPVRLKERIAVSLDRMNQKPVRGTMMPNVDSRFIELSQLESRKLERITGLDLSSWYDFGVGDGRG